MYDSHASSCHPRDALWTAGSSKAAGELWVLCHGASLDQTEITVTEGGRAWQERYGYDVRVAAAALVMGRRKEERYRLRWPG